MEPFAIQTKDTNNLHQTLNEIVQRDPEQAKGLIERANTSMAESGAGQLHAKKTLDLALTALLLNQQDKDRLNELATRFHQLVERLLDKIIGDPQLLARYFSDHSRIFPFLAKCPGSPHWQIVSRYDFALQPDGSPKLLELNTGCPGGYFVSERLTNPTLAAFSGADLEEEHEIWCPLNPDAGSIIRTLTTLEENASIEPGLIAVLNDENELHFELDLLVEALSQHGRKSRIINAADLELVDGQLHHQGDRISSTYNKFRISIPGSPNHCWQDGFEERYRAYLTAHREGRVVSVNSICGMSVAEDKGLLGLFHHRDFADHFTDEEKTLIRNFSPWTSRIEDREAIIDGKPVNLLEHIRSNKDRLVIKPANEGRGFGVVIGREVDQETWNAACTPRRELPSIAQEFIESWSLSISSNRDNQLKAEPMFLTFAIAITMGEPCGFVSRVSSDLVTNVAQRGFGQAVFLKS